MFFFCDQQHGVGLLSKESRSYLPLIIRKGERPVTRLLNIVTTLAVLTAAAYPAIYAYASLA